MKTYHQKTTIEGSRLSWGDPEKVYFAFDKALFTDDMQIIHNKKFIFLKKGTSSVHGWLDNHNDRFKKLKRGHDLIYFEWKPIGTVVKVEEQQYTQEGLSMLNRAWRQAMNKKNKST